MDKTILSEIIKDKKIEYTISIKNSMKKECFIEIREKNLDSNQIKKLNIDPLFEDNFIDTLTYFFQEIKNIRHFKSNKLTKEREKEICRRYLKGVEIVDLKLQFRLDEKIIKEVLHKHNIEIVNQSLSESGWKLNNWKSKKNG